MTVSRLLLPLGALAGAAALLLSSSSEAYVFLGGSLDLTQRDFRIHDNFVNAEAQDNLTPEPEFPGATGAVLAIWKGVVEWGSELHGSGAGDPTQPGDLGSGGANFDATYQGLVSSPGGTNDNVISMLPGFGGGLIAFTELPISDGWRIRFYEQPSVWHDGPGLIPNGPFDMDLQGVAAHEYGHALGLDHTLVAGATMQGGASGNQVENRSLEADDIAGVQALYGLASFNKPRILHYELQAGAVLVEGTNFAASGNELWFTRGSGSGDGTPVMVTGLSSSAGGTRISAPIPAEAGPGDLLVHIPGVAHDTLSNAFPFDPVLGYCPPPVIHGVGKTTSQGTTPNLSVFGSASLTYGGLGFTALGGIPNAAGILFYGSAPASKPFMGGTLYSSGPYVRDRAFTFGFFGDLSVQVSLDPTMIGTTRVYQLWFKDSGDPFGVGLSNGVEVTFCP
jgi:hypothetical protein